MKTRQILLMDEVDKKLARYARIRQIKPEEAAAAAIEHYLRESADLQIRIADARRAFEKANGPA